MRKVKIFKWQRKSETSSTCVKVEDGEGLFITFGVDCEEYATGGGTFTTAIVEMPDGTVRNLSVDLIQFIEQPAEDGAACPVCGTVYKSGEHLSAKEFRSRLLDEAADKLCACCVRAFEGGKPCKEGCWMCAVVRGKEE